MITNRGSIMLQIVKTIFYICRFISSKIKTNMFTSIEYQRGAMRKCKSLSIRAIFIRKSTYSLIFARADRRGMTNGIGNKRAIGSTRIANIRRAYTSWNIHQTSYTCARASVYPRDAMCTCRWTQSQRSADGSMRIARSGAAPCWDPRNVWIFHACIALECDSSAVYNTTSFVRVRAAYRRSSDALARNIKLDVRNSNMLSQQSLH